MPADRLYAEAQHLMNRMRLIDPEVLAVNKRVVNLAQELMGARTLQRLAAELDARGHLAEGARAFGAAVMEKGVKETVRMRDERFGTALARVDEPDVGE